MWNPMHRTCSFISLVASRCWLCHQYSKFEGQYHHSCHHWLILPWGPFYSVSASNHRFPNRWMPVQLCLRILWCPWGCSVWQSSPSMSGWSLWNNWVSLSASSQGITLRVMVSVNGWIRSWVSSYKFIATIIKLISACCSWSSGWGTARRHTPTTTSGWEGSRVSCL